MKAKKVLIASSLAIVLYMIAVRGIRNVDVAVKSVVFRSMDFLASLVYLTVNLAVKNPLSIGVTVRGITGDLYINGQLAGKVNQNMNTYLTGGSESILPVDATISVNNVTQIVLDAITVRDFSSVVIAFNGSVLVGDLNIAIPVQFEKALEA